ncbi:MAG: DUF6017 domain-containing protein [Oscillospiraceae bacterium]|jgi:hypothetical protein|nr:DUF6017 domain-containing protein [Oscillospiraceae bacterium]
MEKIDNKIYPQEKSNPIKSFREVLAEVYEQIEFDCLNKSGDAEQYREIVLIITEVLMLNPASEIHIAGSTIAVRMAQEVFRELRAEHIEYVVNCFNSVPYEIKSKKAYLRTSLYNAVFTFANHVNNQYHKDSKG